MYRAPYSRCGAPANASFGEFLRSPFAMYGRCSPSRLRPTPMHVWSEHAVTYRRLKWAPKVILRDADILHEERLVSALGRLGRMLKLPPRAYALPDVLPPVKTRYTNWTRSSYEHHRYKLLLQPHHSLRWFSVTDMEFVNSQLPDEAMRGLFARQRKRLSVLQRVVAEMQRAVG